MKKLLKPFVLSIFLLAVTMTAVFAQANEDPASDFKYSLNREGDGVVIREYRGESKNVVIPAMIEEIPVVGIGDDCFRIEGITSVIIPDTVRRIGKEAFYKCPLTQITLPQSLISIGGLAFAGCQLTSLVLPDSVETIEWDAFSGNPITELILSKSLYSIEQRAFSNCTKLQSLTLSKSLRQIGGSAFGNCKSLMSITVPADAEEIIFYSSRPNDGAFGGCSSLPPCRYVYSIEGCYDRLATACGI